MVAGLLKPVVGLQAAILRALPAILRATNGVACVSPAFGKSAEGRSVIETSLPWEWMSLGFQACDMVLRS